MGSAQWLVRNFLRHLADMPIEIDNDGPLRQAGWPIENFSPGGLACRCEHPLPVGAGVILLTIRLIRLLFRASGSVAWCRRAGCDSQGRGLDAETAAGEWIERFAVQFPMLEQSTSH